MAQSFEIQGIIHSIGDTNSYGNNGFQKREFVIKLSGPGENSTHPNHIALEVVKDNCALMDAYNLGDEVIVHFNLSGRLWSGNGKGEKCFTSLQAWRVQPATQANRTAATTPAYANPSYDEQMMPNYDLPQADISYGKPSASLYDDDLPF